MDNPAIDLSGLLLEFRKPVGDLAQRLLDDVADNLRSLSVVGSALTPDFHPKRSDINTVLVVGRRSHELLKLLAAYGRKAGRSKLGPPLLMTEEYLRQSVDVFSVGLLDFQFNHVTVIGADPFAGLAFDRRDVRLQCEQQLKQTLIDLRQGYIRAGGDWKRVGDLLLSVVGSLVPLARAVLWLVGLERPLEASRTFAAAARHLALNSTALELPLKLYADRRRPTADQVDPMFENLYRVVDQMSRAVDRLDVGA